MFGVSSLFQVPDPPPGHKWKDIKHDNTVTWLATWKENVNDQNKYVQLASDSHIKGRSDMRKYDTARELKKHIAKIRKDYTEDLKSKIVGCGPLKFVSSPSQEWISIFFLKSFRSLLEDGGQAASHGAVFH